MIFVPPFAEEMNRSKRMYVLCSRLLANAGVHAICFDFAGTGDSSGEWGEYRLTDWKANLTDTYNYVRRFSTKTSFVTLRDSALIAFELIKHANIKIERCVLWYPIDNREALIRQLIRMKIAAAMASDLKKITSKEVLSGIEQSGFLEVGGYHVRSYLLDEFRQQNVTNHIQAVLDRTHVHWMTTGKKQTSPHLPVCLSKLNLSEPQQTHMHLHQVEDVKFWMQQEVTISPKLLRETRQIFLT